MLWRVWYDLGPSRKIEDLAAKTGNEEYFLRSLAKRMQWDKRNILYQDYLARSISTIFQERTDAEHKAVIGCATEIIRMEIGRLYQQLLAEDYDSSDPEKRINRIHKIGQFLSSFGKISDGAEKKADSGIIINIAPSVTVDSSPKGQVVETTAKVSFEEVDVNGSS